MNSIVLKERANWNPSSLPNPRLILALESQKTYQLIIKWRKS